MTVALSYSVQGSLSDWLTGTPFPTAPTSLKLGLLTAAPNPNGTGIVEPDSGAAYARQTITLGAKSQSGNATTKLNSGSIVFGPATSDWAQVNYVGLFDQDGNLLSYAPLAASRVAPSGDTISFAIGTVQIRIQ